jgi:hypothetical protein
MATRHRVPIRNLADVYVSGLTITTAKAFRSGARARGMTLADYLTELVGLHEDLRGAADNGNRLVNARVYARGLLTKRGLETVRA